MIVTCPSCSAKYRVRDDAVPTEGAQLKCPECATMFLAHRPAHDDQELAGAIERLTEARDAIQGELHEAEKKLKDVQADAERKQKELLAANEAAGRALAARDKELQEALAQAAASRGTAEHSASLLAQVGQLQQQLDTANRMRAEATRPFEQKVQELARELQAARDEADRLKLSGSVPAPVTVGTPALGNSSELQEARTQLLSAQKLAGKLTHDVDVARREARSAKDRADDLERQLAAASGGGAKNSVLEQEVQRLKEQLATAAGGGDMAPEVATLVGAIAPMLWGLDQAIDYIEPFAQNEAALGTHVQKLKLLAGLLKRLAEAAGHKAG
jgi:predicted Zn finger-like uncharacterized protein